MCNYSIAQKSLKEMEENYQVSKKENTKLLEEVESKEVELKSFEEMKNSLLKEVRNT